MNSRREPDLLILRCTRPATNSIKTPNPNSVIREPPTRARDLEQKHEKARICIHHKRFDYPP
jgi:hypothetical protein